MSLAVNGFNNFHQVNPMASNYYYPQAHLNYNSSVVSNQATIPTNQYPLNPVSFLTPAGPNGTNTFSSVPSAMVASAPFTQLKSIGEGSYGSVYSGVITNNPENKPLFRLFKEGDIVAVKNNVKRTPNNKLVESIAEMHMLKTVKEHPFCMSAYQIGMGNVNWIPRKQKGIASVPDDIYFVCKRGSCDLKKFLIGVEYIKDMATLKRIVLDLLLAIEFIHSRGITHLDLKPQNVIAFTQKQKYEKLQVTDFGLAQYLDPNHTCTMDVMTSWYRAPEIWMKEQYTQIADVWSVGCMIMEIFHKNGMPFLHAGANDEYTLPMLASVKVSSERHHIDIIKKLYPENKLTVEQWMEMTKNRPPLKDSLGFNASDLVEFNKSLGTLDELMEMVDKFLQFDPRNRWTITQGLNSAFFKGYGYYIATYRTSHGIDARGRYLTESTLIYPFSGLSEPVRYYRTRGYNLFYSFINDTNGHVPKMHDPAVAEWYNHRILMHAIELFDRSLFLNTAPMYASLYEIECVCATFLYIMVKFFPALKQAPHMLHPLQILRAFSLKIPEATALKQMELFQKAIIVELNYRIYVPTCYERPVHTQGTSNEATIRNEIVMHLTQPI